MSENTHAFMFREVCGCVTGVTVEDRDTLHYVNDLASWKRRKGDGWKIERVSIEEARICLGQTFDRMKAIGWKGHPRPCTDARPVNVTPVNEQLPLAEAPRP